jgi:hypothetical protein
MLSGFNVLPSPATTYSLSLVSVFEVNNSVNIDDEVVIISWQGNYHINAEQMEKNRTAKITVGCLLIT